MSPDAMLGRQVARCPHGDCCRWDRRPQDRKVAKRQQRRRERLTWTADQQENSTA